MTKVVEKPTSFTRRIRKTSLELSRAKIPFTRRKNENGLPNPEKIFRIGTGSTLSLFAGVSLTKRRRRTTPIRAGTKASRKSL